MIVSLQKRHRQIWTVFAIVLPIVFVASYFTIPERAFEEESKDYSLLPIIFNEREDDFFKITERKLEREEDIKYQMEVTIKQPFKQTSALIFIAESESVQGKEPIGQIFSKGSYSFDLLDPLQTNDKIIFYNPLTKEVFHIVE